MLIECSGCNSKIRVPESAAGKRVKCPKCATVIRVPEAENAPANETPEESGVSSKPIPPPPAPEPEPEKEAESDSISERPSSSGVKPPPIKKTRASSVDYDDDDEDDESTPPKKRRRDRDDDDSDLDVRKKKRRAKAPSNNGMAMTSMILGIASIVIGFPGCCCCGPLAFIGGVGGVAAVICGFMGKKTPGSEGMALTGIICGFAAIAFALIYVVLLILSIFFNIGVAGMNGMNFNQGPGFNNPRFVRPGQPGFRP